jgi:acyl-CoA synthetase (AMP-forming)/AMP-acid ligase II
VVDEASAYATWLVEQGGDDGGPFHVGVLLENVPEYVFLLAGAALCGAVIVGLNPMRRGDDLAGDVSRTDCRFVIADPAFMSSGHLSSVDVPIVSPAPGEAGPLEFSPSPAGLYLLIFTSGSTGHPKAVKVSHGRAARSATGFSFRRNEVLYSAMPLFHGNALFSSLLPAFHAGCRLVLRRRFSASAFLDDIRTHGCTYFNTVGRAIAHINATPPSPLDRDHRLKWVLGPETSEVDKAAFTARFGVPIFDGYGSSENAIILMPAPARPDRPAPLGTAPPDTDAVVMDPDTAEERPPAEFDDAGRLLNPAAAVGELVGRNVASRFEGYYNDPDAEAARLRNGWYWSGDLAYRDQDGVFYFAGRSGDWLRVDSENFTAGPVERILARAPGVTGVAVFPVPDARTGDQVMAAVESGSFDPSAFTAFLADQADFSPKWVPRFVRVVKDLPVTGTDKLDKRPLRTTGWRTTDPLWWRPTLRSTEFVPMTADDIAALESEFEKYGRTNLLVR